MLNTLARFTGAALLASVATPVAVADQAAEIFDGLHVHAIDINFDETNWYTTLYDAWGNDDFYLSCTFTWTDPDGDETVLEEVGARFKGNSSFIHSGTRKSMKLDFNEFIDTQEFLGMKKVNLNNNFRDPSLMREKLFLDFLQGRMNIHRATYAHVTINGESWGLYTLCEQVDKTFIEKQWGSNDDGNLYKGEYAANLAYQGSDPEDYRDNYEKKTNEEEDEWADIIALCQFLDETNSSDMDELLPGVIDIDQHLAVLAASAIFASYDSYIGPAHNFYMYHRSQDDLWRHVNWDNNMAFGNFRNVLPNGTDPITVALNWHREGNGPNAARPFADAIFENDVLYRRYLRTIASMLRTGFDADSFDTRIADLDAVIRDHVADDDYYDFEFDDYVQSLETDVDIGPFNSIGLRRFVEDRGAYIRSQLDEAASPSDIHLNEIQTSNVSTIMDDAGDYEPWVEIANPGPGTVGLSDLYLSDDVDDLDAWQLPFNDMSDGSYGVIWLDGEPGEGSDHANFTMGSEGGTLLLSTMVNGNPQIIDEVIVPPLGADESWGRRGDTDGEWEITGAASPAGPNTPAPPPLSELIVINEVMADNTSTIADEAGEYDDWIELFNVGSAPADLSGCTMSDSLDTPEEWTFPEGTVLAAGEYLIIWADEDLDQGPLHADFKFASQGDLAGIWTPDGGLVDSVEFGDQSPDVSFGRLPDGGSDWQYLQIPTPGEANTADPAQVPELYINEVMASNETTFSDEAGEYDDWIEIYNPGNEDIDMGGLFMTDDLMDAGAWLVPDGVVVPANGFIVIWADNDPEQGDHHGTFQLSGSGETVGLFALDGVTIIDSVDFPALESDAAYGRIQDGGPDWDVLPATPGTSNQGDTEPCPADLDQDGTIGVNDVLACISAWATPAGDTDGNGDTDVNDLLFIISLYGKPCP